MSEIRMVLFDDADLAVLQTAADAAGQPLDAYVVTAALTYTRQQAEAQALAAAENAVLRQRQLAIFYAYQTVLGYKVPEQHKGRVAKRAKQLALDERDPAELPLVAAWIRQVDRRYQHGQFLPLEEIATQWGAWQQRTRKPAPAVTGSNPPTPEPAAPVFGDYAAWDELGDAVP